MLAAQEGHVDVVRYLVEQGANKDHQSKVSVSVYMSICLYMSSHLFAYAYMHMYMYVYVCICMYMYVCMHEWNAVFVNPSVTTFSFANVCVTITMIRMALLLSWQLLIRAMLMLLDIWYMSVYV